MHNYLIQISHPAMIKFIDRKLCVNRTTWEVMRMSWNLSMNSNIMANSE